MALQIVVLALAATAAAVKPFGVKPKTGYSDEAPKQYLEVNEDGSYKYGYETDTGISANEEGVGGVKVEGKFFYISPEGEHIETSYIADENGFQPTGSHVPVVPEYVARSLAYIASHPGYVEPSAKKGF